MGHVDVTGRKGAPIENNPVAYSTRTECRSNTRIVRIESINSINASLNLLFICPVIILVQAV